MSHLRLHIYTDQVCFSILPKLTNQNIETLFDSNYSKIKLCVSLFVMLLKRT